MEKNFLRDNYNNSPSLHNLRNRRVQQITSNKIAPLIPTHSYVSSIASTSTSFNDQIKEAEPSKTVFSIFKKDCFTLSESSDEGEETEETEEGEINAQIDDDDESGESDEEDQQYYNEGDFVKEIILFVFYIEQKIILIIENKILNF
jgi:hypothetical protein